MPRLFSRLYAPAFLAGTLLAASPAPAIDISGTWTGKITLPATGLSLEELMIKLQQSGTQIKGTLLFPKPHAEVPLTGTLSGRKLSLVSPLTKGLAVTINARVRGFKRVSGQAVLDYDMPNQVKKQDHTLLEMTR
jgi:hypothetical protein